MRGRLRDLAAKHFAAPLDEARAAIASARAARLAMDRVASTLRRSVEAAPPANLSFASSPSVKTIFVTNSGFVRSECVRETLCRMDRRVPRDQNRYRVLRARSVLATPRPRGRLREAAPTTLPCIHGRACTFSEKDPAEAGVTKGPVSRCASRRGCKSVAAARQPFG